jgi:hypothetical protein
MPKFLEDKTLKIINWILIIASVLVAIFVGSRIIEDLMRVPGVSSMLNQLGVGPTAGLTIINIIYIIIVTLLAIFIGYTILKIVILSAYERDYLTRTEILFIYLVSTLVAIGVGLATDFIGDFRILITTIVYLIVLFLLTNLFVKWKKGGHRKVNIHLAIYGIILLIIAMPMVRNLILIA